MLGILRASPLLCLLLISCGGGGEDAAPQPRPLEIPAAPAVGYSGSVETFEITTENAHEVTRHVVTALQLVQALGGQDPQGLEPAANGRLSGARTERSAGGKAEIEWSFDEDNVGARITRFTGFVDGQGNTIDGMLVERRLTPFDEGLRTTVDYHDLRVVRGGSGYVYRGSVHRQSSDPDDPGLTITVTGSFTATDVTSGDVLFLTDLSRVGSGGHTNEYSMRIFRGAAGGVALSTDGPLTWSWIPQYLFEKGGPVRITGAGANLTLMPLNRTRLAEVLDLDRDGQGDVSRLTTFEQIGMAPDPSDQNSPVARATFAVGGTAGQVNGLSALFSRDTGRGFLSHDWALLSAPPGANVVFIGPDGPSGACHEFCV